MPEELSNYALHKLGRCDDRNFPEGIEREQIGVAGDDQIRFAVDGQFQKFVVLGITAGSDPLGNIDQLGRRDTWRNQSRKSDWISGARRGRARVTNSSCSVVADLRRR